MGQHSLNCAAEAKARGWSKRQQLACLLHDASEGYISDIIRPVKIYLTNYLEIESKIMGTILTHFGLDDLTEEENLRWKQIDDEILELELKTLLHGEENRAVPQLFSVPDLAEHTPGEIEVRFLQEAESCLRQPESDQDRPYERLSVLLQSTWRYKTERCQDGGDRRAEKYVETGWTDK